MIAYILTFLLFIAKSGPVVVSQAYSDKYSCEKTMADLADKAEHDDKVVGWEFVGKPCEPIHEANKI